MDLIQWLLNLKTLLLLRKEKKTKGDNQKLFFHEGKAKTGRRLQKHLNSLYFHLLSVFIPFFLLNSSELKFFEFSISFSLSTTAALTPATGPGTAAASGTTDGFRRCYDLGLVSKTEIAKAVHIIEMSPSKVQVNTKISPETELLIII